jgi:protein phosphatase methylesterase 1
MLALAGAERMDKELTIAQMSGKFRLELIYDVGHAIQEDNPTALAERIKQFLSIFKIQEKAKAVFSITNFAGEKIIINQ